MFSNLKILIWFLVYYLSIIFVETSYLFVHNFNIDVMEAFMRYNLAPLALRRDIAMLGFLHKCNMPDAPADMKRLFPGRTGRRLWNILSFNRRVFHPDLANKSLFNLTTVYNALPHYTRSLDVL